jgi:hypothetical protein
VFSSGGLDERIIGTIDEADTAAVCPLGSEKMNDRREGFAATSPAAAPAVSASNVRVCYIVMTASTALACTSIID